MKNYVLATQLKYIKQTINMNLAEISNDESCIAPSSGGSSMNWIMGHLITQTPGMLKAAGSSEEIKDIEKYNELYGRGKPNVTADTALKLENILELYNSTHDNLIKQLEENEIEGEENLTTLTVLTFHETYHDGQIGTLRRVLGKDSVIK